MIFQQIIGIILSLKKGGSFKLKSKSLKFLTVLLSAVLTLQLSVAAFSAASGTQTTDEVVIFHTNDMHGSVAYSEGSCIGLDRVAALKDQTENSILVDAGDATQGVPFASLTKGADVIDVMNEAGYDLMAAGNHEFDYGTDQLLRNAEAADFPILAANVYKDGEPLLDCHTVIEVADKSIGFFGITTAETATATNPEGIKGVEFRDEVETAKHEIDELSELSVDAIIAVTHIGEYTNVPCDSTKLAEEISQECPDKLTAIIDGHSHTLEDKVVDDILIMQTGTALSNVGKLTLSFDDNGDVSAAGTLISCDEAESITPKQSVTDKINAVNESQKDILSQEVCKLDNSLWGGTIDGIADPRLVETNLGDFAADAYKDAAERFIANAQGMDKYDKVPVVAVENGGGIRSTIHNGTVTKGDLVNTFPFSNTLIMKEITPKTLFEMLEVSVGSITDQDKETGLLTGQPEGGFLQVSGIMFSYNPSAEAGSKVTEVMLEGSSTPLDRNDDTTPLVLVANNFIMNGGSGYSMLASIEQLGEIGGELETVEAYAIAQANASNNTLSGDNIKGRINIDGEYVKKDYTAKVLVLNDDETPAVDAEVSYYVDGVYTGTGVTDSDGYLSITVADGPHGVSLAADQQQIYINNYTGAGTQENEYRGLPSLSYREPTAVPSTDPTSGTEPTEETQPSTSADVPVATDDEPATEPSSTVTNSATPDSPLNNGGSSVQTGDFKYLFVYGTLAILALAAVYVKAQRKSE